MAFSFRQFLVIVFLLVFAKSVFAQQTFALNFSGFYPSKLANLATLATPDSELGKVQTEVIARANYLAQSPLCKGGPEKGTKTVKLPVSINSTQNGYAFSARRHLGAPCGYVLVSLSFGLGIKGSDLLFSEELITQGPAQGNVRQLPQQSGSVCRLGQYSKENVVICQPQESASYYLPQDWSRQNFRYDFLVLPE